MATATLEPVLPDDLDRLAGEVARAACEAKLRLATAESCTGGLLAAALTDIDGCAHVFERGFVAYTHAAKAAMLGVPGAVLEGDGAVSDAAARAMAEGALARSKADLALAVTGFAGQGGPGDEPGLVFVGLAGKRLATRVEERRFGDVGRGRVRLEALRLALGLLSEALSDLPSDLP